MSEIPRHFSILLDTVDISVRQALTYLFVVVLEQDLEILDGQEGWEERLSRMKGKDVVFLHAQEDAGLSQQTIIDLKASNPAPVVIVLDGIDQSTGVHAFQAGADDVVHWPSSLHELALRIGARMGQNLHPMLYDGTDSNWETEAYIAERANLTTSEAQVLRVLFRRTGQIVSRDELSQAVDARPWRYGDRKFDVHVAKLRKKLSDAFGGQLSVSTIRSVGYRLSSEGLRMLAPK